MIDRQTRNFPWKLPSLSDDGKWDESAHLLSSAAPLVELDSHVRERGRTTTMTMTMKRIEREREREREKERRIIWIHTVCIICSTA